MPTDNEMTKAHNEGKKGDGEAVAKLLINLIWLGGDREIINNDLLFQAIANEIVKIINLKLLQKATKQKNKYLKK